MNHIINDEDYQILINIKKRLEPQQEYEIKMFWFIIIAFILGVITGLIPVLLNLE